MKLKLALLLILVLAAAFFPAAAIQNSIENATIAIPHKTSEPLTTLCGLITPHDPGSGGGGKGET